MLKKICLGAALSWTGIIFYLCLIKASNLPSVDILYLDKFVHAFFHFVFSLLWFLVLRFYYRNQSNSMLLGIVFFISLSFGITIELFQAFFTISRNGDLIDVLSNTTGALLALTMIKFLGKNDFLSKSQSKQNPA